MEVKADTYRVWSERSTVFFDGTMRLSGPDAYAPVYSLASGLIASENSVVLDLTNLVFLNSSGINLLAKLTIEARNKPDGALAVKGSSSIPWQSKSLPNLKKLYPALTLTLA
ncbi:slr1659 superfamily regulator [Pararhizobium sp. PWRC1-1]|uniref:slr1659 superfamily regulator n=1 Tax=Pararhizobium sp. PWRC1-1 TaxID=2804566 RepID=UPI003CFAE22C